MNIVTGSLINAIKKVNKFKGENLGVVLYEENGEVFLYKSIREGENSYFTYKQIKAKVEINKVAAGEKFTISDNALKVILLIKESEITFNGDEITTSKRTIKNIQNDKEFIKPDEVGEVIEEIKVSSVEYQRLMETTKSLATDFARPILRTVSFKGGNVCTLDGYRLTLRKGAFDLQREYNVPGTLLKETLGVIDKKSKSVNIAFTEKHTVINIDDVEVITNLVEGTFIKYESLIPTDCTTTLNVDTEELSKELKFLGKTKASAITLDISGKGITIENGDVKINIDSANKIGKDIRIAFNIRYITEALKNYDGYVACEFNSIVNPIIMTQDKYKGLDLILPIRLNKQRG